jgi:hypothetical protein
MLTLAALLPDSVNHHLGWWLLGVCILIGLIVGWRDMLRLSLKRIWAISGVCFDESIRRRVLLITPLAILGVIIVSQLQHPLDEQDAIRQTIKFCIFATGLVVAVTTIILACTNLPREIDNRVIFTVVTKPATRLEIVLGKVIGFARVSLVILLIMGIFSYGYLYLRAWDMRRAIDLRLSANAVPASSVATLKHYSEAGLLNAKKIERPDSLQFFARLPKPSDSRRYFFGNGEGNVNVAFDMESPVVSPAEEEAAGQNGLVVVAAVGYVRQGTSASAATQPTTQQSASTSRPYYGPFTMPPEERAAIMAGNKPTQNPTVTIEVLDENMNSLGTASPIGPVKNFELTRRDGISEVQGIIDPKVARSMKGRVYIRVVGLAKDTQYFVDTRATPVPIKLGLPVSENQIRLIPSASQGKTPLPPIFLTRSGSFGEQLRGGKTEAPVAVYEFHDARVVADADGMAPFELKGGIERSGSDDAVEQLDENTDVPTIVSIQVRNLGSGALSDPVTVEPESNRTVFFRVPAKSMEGGNFELILRCLTKGDFLGLNTQSLSLVTQRQPFAWNLTKSMLILWLMTILVTAIAIFTSTFLSWPIAVVLTLVILLGHWGVEQLGDATQPGIGNQVVMDFGLRSPAKAEAVRATVEKLSSFLNFVSTILPDISKYSAVEAIESGISIPPEQILEALAVTLGFGVPLVLLAYVFLKNKEVAP